MGLWTLDRCKDTLRSQTLRGTNHQPGPGQDRKQAPASQVHPRPRTTLRLHRPGPHRNAPHPSRQTPCHAILLLLLLHILHAVCVCLERPPRGSVLRLKVFLLKARRAVCGAAGQYYVVTRALGSCLGRLGWVPRRSARRADPSRSARASEHAPPRAERRREERARSQHSSPLAEQAKASQPTTPHSHARTHLRRPTGTLAQCRSGSAQMVLCRSGTVGPFCSSSVQVSRAQRNQHAP